MTANPVLGRRALLGTVAALWTLAGCTAPGTDGGDGTPSTASGGSDPESDTATTTTTTTADGESDDGTGATTRTTTETTTSTTAGTTAELDLREANVTGVSVGRDDDGYVFDVTLYHDDDGESGYANWWQVETLDGDRVGRRDLAHPHGTREFTRSNFEPYEIPDGTACVVVRGHDETHGYGGQAALVAPGSGAVRFVDQGAEPASFDDGDCPS